MKNKNLTSASIIAAAYVVLTMISYAMGLSGGVIQVRFSEALCVLACFTPAAVPGLFVGCILANILTGAALWDVVFGSLATLIGAVFTRMLKNHRFIALIPPIAANTLIIPFVLTFAYGIPGGVGYFMLTVGLGEVISCGVFGALLYSALKKAGF